MNNLQDKIKLFLKKHNIDKPNMVYLVAFSGGYDSMCLLNILREITTNKIIALHLNHNWRGEESDLEEINCINFCKNRGIEIYTEQLSSDIPHTETAAREARYNFFEKCSKKFNSNIIFTGHNKNDNAETLIYRICKGTGIYGLQGISEVRDKYYRPLLDIPREDIENYCINNNLAPNNDSSNRDTKYSRNFIRSTIIPELKSINENITDTLTSLSEVAKEETQIVQEYLSLIEKEIVQDGKIDTQKYLGLSEAIQKRIVYNLFINNKLDYDRKKITDIWKFIINNSSSKSGKTCSITTNLWIYTSQKYIELIKKNEKQNYCIHIDKEGEYKIEDNIFKIEKYTQAITKYPPDSENIAYVDLSKTDFNFELRTRQDGDIIQPLGADGCQKLKKYLNTKKIPNHQKNCLYFLTQEKDILWAINLGISDKIKVVTNPTHKLSFYKGRENEH